MAANTTTTRPRTTKQLQQQQKMLDQQAAANAAAASAAAMVSAAAKETSKSKWHPLLICAPPNSGFVPFVPHTTHLGMWLDGDVPQYARRVYDDSFYYIVNGVQWLDCHHWPPTSPSAILVDRNVHSGEYPIHDHDNDDGKQYVVKIDDQHDLRTYRAWSMQTTPLAHASPMMIHTSNNSNSGMELPPLLLQMAIQPPRCRPPFADGCNTHTYCYRNFLVSSTLSSSAASSPSVPVLADRRNLREIMRDTTNGITGMINGRVIEREWIHDTPLSLTSQEPSWRYMAEIPRKYMSQIWTVLPVPSLPHTIHIDTNGTNSATASATVKAVARTPIMIDSLDGWLPRYHSITNAPVPYVISHAAGSTDHSHLPSRSWDLSDKWTGGSSSSSSSSGGVVRGGKRKEPDSSVIANTQHTKIARSTSSDGNTSNRSSSSSSSSSSTSSESKDNSGVTSCLVTGNNGYFIFDETINRFRYLKFVRRPHAVPNHCDTKSSSSSSSGSMASPPFELFHFNDDTLVHLTGLRHSHAYGSGREAKVYQTAITSATNDGIPSRSFVISHGRLYELRWRVIDGNDEKAMLHNNNDTDDTDAKTDASATSSSSSSSMSSKISDSEPLYGTYGHAIHSREWYQSTTSVHHTSGGRLVMEMIQHMTWCDRISAIQSIISPDGTTAGLMISYVNKRMVSNEPEEPVIPNGVVHQRGIYWLSPPHYSSSSTSIIPDANASPLVLPSSAMFVGHFYGKYVMIPDDFIFGDASTAQQTYAQLIWSTPANMLMIFDAVFTPEAAYDWELVPLEGEQRPSCQYGDACYRKHAQHFIDEAHPADDDYTKLTKKSTKKNDDDDDDEDNDDSDGEPTRSTRSTRSTRGTRAAAAKPKKKTATKKYRAGSESAILAEVREQYVAMGGIPTERPRGSLYPIDEMKPFAPSYRGDVYGLPLSVIMALPSIDIQPLMITTIARDNYLNSWSSWQPNAALRRTPDLIKTLEPHVAGYEHSFVATSDVIDEQSAQFWITHGWHCKKHVPHLCAPDYVEIDDLEGFGDHFGAPIWYRERNPRVSIYNGSIINNMASRRTVTIMINPPPSLAAYNVDFKRCVSDDKWLHDMEEKEAKRQKLDKHELKYRKTMATSTSALWFGVINGVLGDGARVTRVHDAHHHDKPIAAASSKKKPNQRTTTTAAAAPASSSARVTRSRAR